MLRLLLQKVQRFIGSAGLADADISSADAARPRVKSCLRSKTLLTEPKSVDYSCRPGVKQPYSKLGISGMAQSCGISLLVSREGDIASVS